MTVTYATDPQGCLWHCTPAYDEAFDLFKWAFTSALTLHHFDPALSPIVEIDASHYAIAGISSSAVLDGLAATSWLAHGNEYIFKILVFPLLEFLRDGKHDENICVCGERDFQ